mmetsp:Transcript_6694/g.17023  ORF Transcript_6694/g.17023 Transcript_6694/m.17023 type:complete len:313 (+) Transcript_6694:1365-2303(+)
MNTLLLSPLAVAVAAAAALVQGWDATQGGFRIVAAPRDANNAVVEDEALQVLRFPQARNLEGFDKIRAAHKHDSRRHAASRSLGNPLPEAVQDDTRARPRRLVSFPTIYHDNARVLGGELAHPDAVLCTQEPRLGVPVTHWRHVRAHHRVLVRALQGFLGDVEHLHVEGMGRVEGAASEEDNRHSAVAPNSPKLVNGHAPLANSASSRGSFVHRYPVLPFRFRHHSALPLLPRRQARRLKRVRPRRRSPHRPSCFPSAEVFGMASCPPCAGPQTQPLHRVDDHAPDRAHPAPHTRQCHSGPWTRASGMMPQG